MNTQSAFRAPRGAWAVGMLLSLILLPTSTSAQQQGFGPAPINDCTDYVNRALQQVSLARACNFTGPRWTANGNEHMSWCKRVTPAQRGYEDEQRYLGLDWCKNPPGRAPLIK